MTEQLPACVRAEREGRVLVITLDRPGAHNALNREVLGGLLAAVARTADPGIRAAVLTGSGSRSFCAGADLTELAGQSLDEAMRGMSLGQRVMRAVERAPVPVIAAVNGLALGGGFELALATSFPVLSTRAALGLPEAGLGLIPGYGGTQRLREVVGPQLAQYLMLTGRRLDAARAYAHGLTPVPPCEPEDVLTVATGLAAEIGERGPQAVASIRTAVDVGRAHGPRAGRAVEAALSVLAAAGGESDEGIAAFLQKRRPGFDDVAP